MIGNGRKTIGVFISTYGEFQEVLSKSISKRSKELNYNVVFFSSFGGYGQDNYDEGQAQITEIPIYEKLDGIILTPDTYAIKGFKERIINNIKSRSNCPIVSVRSKLDDYYNVLIDDNTVLEDIIRHFIVVHGFTRINFLAGPKGFPDSDKRLDSYKRILEEYHIPIEDERIYYGDFWRVKPYEAVDYWISSSLPLPQAIICANDYMAITTCEALYKKGIKVPEQIAVSGCDDSTDSSEYTPTITTAQMPIDDMGIEAVNKIYRHIEGQEQPKDSYVRTIPIYRESCSCKYNPVAEQSKHKRYYINRYIELQKAVSQVGYMSGDLTCLTKIEQINNRLRFYVYENVGFTDFYLCLFPDWQDYKDETEKIVITEKDEMLMEIGIKDTVDFSRIRFSRKDLFPTEFLEDTPSIYFVSMLHHQENAFGYAVLRYKDVQIYSQTFQAWMINVGNALENVRIHGELNRLVYKLEDMYIRDELTGIYNRRGLALLGNKYLKQAKEEKITLMVFSADLDNLKLINDNYGHINGDIALKAVADALQKAADDDEICIRGGGDEFTVIGLEYNEQKMNRFKQKFIDELEKFNQSGYYLFHIYVSYGWSLMVPEENSTVEDFMMISDAEMYKQKHEKKSRGIRANFV